MKTEANTPEELLPPAGDIHRRFTPDSVSNAHCCVTERLTALVGLLNDCLTLEQDSQTEGGNTPEYLNIHTRNYLGLASTLRGLTDQLNYLQSIEATTQQLPEVTP
ncbi:hypothetical protein [Gilvimarinus polysaccharolyticus]|uniref:hypothetical protein n=1 Tax=Gilvimarinus polysaccharolyticus TaxID=863921 RepID=UPI000673A53F|nr:hypothetical protein [Gilvimarinus polysaccharolyticus]